MNILINESQYKRLFRPNVKIELIEGEEEQKYLKLLYENDRIKKIKIPKVYQYLLEEIKDDCDQIDKNQSLPQDVKDRKILDLVGHQDLNNNLQKWVEKNIYDSEANGIRFLRGGSKRFIFNITLHWAARIFRDCSKPTEPMTKGIELVRDNIQNIIEFINKKQTDPNVERRAIVMRMSDGDVYNEVIAIRKEMFSKLNNMYKIEFITQMEGGFLYNKYRHPRIYV